MKLRYVWREIDEDGRMLDPDIDYNAGAPLPQFGARALLNTFKGHHTSRESAIEHYQKTYEIDNWATPRELVLLEVYRVG